MQAVPATITVSLCPDVVASPRWSSRSLGVREPESLALCLDVYRRYTLLHIHSNLVHPGSTVSARLFGRNTAR